MDRALRRDIAIRKYISRIKKRLYQIVVPYKNGYNRIRYRKPEDWRDADINSRWVKQLKHNKIYGRSTMNVLEKHYKVKKLREESKNITRELINS